MEPNTFFTATASAGKHYAVKVLDGTNYSTWKHEMTSFLQSKGLYKFITERAEVFKQANANDPVKLEVILESDEKALGEIKCNIASSFNELVVNSSTALDAWEKLETFFSGKETYNKVDLLQQLIDGKLTETGNPVKDVQSFINEKNEIVRRLDSVGMKISQDMQVCIMLARLPDTYDTMRRIIESQPDLSMMKLTAELNREAIRNSSKKRSAPSEEKALAATDTRPPPTKRPRTPQHERKKLKCTYCEFTGHEAGGCWMNPKSSKFKPEFRSSMLKLASRDDNVSNAIDG